jgi:hypothetical protein
MVQKVDLALKFLAWKIGKMKKLNLFILRVATWIASVVLFIIVIRVVEDMQ